MYPQIYNVISVSILVILICQYTFLSENRLQRFSNHQTRLSKFVARSCVGRDDSHNWEHMCNVADIAIGLCPDNMAFETVLEVVTVAWLHDVLDHKYHASEQVRLDMISLIQELHGQANTVWIMRIIERISFSVERKARVNGVNSKGEPVEWDRTLGVKGTMIRNIVSDADKIEAVGATGFMRCAEYTKAKFVLDNGRNMTDKELAIAIRLHATEKLLVMVDQGYIRTPKGVVKCRELEKILDQMITDFEASVN